MQASVLASPRSALPGRVLLGAASSAFGRAIALGTWFFLTPFILGQLGPALFGLWVLASSVVAYGNLLDLGITNAVVREVARWHAVGDAVRDDGAGQDLVATALRLFAALGLAALAAAAWLAPVFPGLFAIPAEQRETTTWLVVLLGVGTALYIPGLTISAVLRGLQRYDLLSALNTGFVLASAGGTAVVLLAGGGVLGMAAINLPIMLLCQVVGVLLIERVAPGLRFGRGRWRSECARRLLSFSAALFVNDLAHQIERRTDEIVIGAMLAVGAVTPYAIAHRLSEVGELLTAQLRDALLPAAAELSALSARERLRAVYLASTRLTLGIYGACGGLLAALAGPILAAWVGPAYAEQSVLVVILTVAGLLATSQWPASAVLQGTAEHRPLAWMSAASAAINLGLSILLAQPLGLVGVALGTLIPTAVVSLGGMLPYALRKLEVGPGLLLREVVLPPAAACAALLAVVVGLRTLHTPAGYLELALFAAPAIAAHVAVHLSFGASRPERQACVSGLTRLRQLAGGSLARVQSRI